MKLLVNFTISNYSIYGKDAEVGDYFNGYSINSEENVLR
jgi:hypothetical protein